MLKIKTDIIVGNGWVTDTSYLLKKNCWIKYISHSPAINKRIYLSDNFFMTKGKSVITDGAMPNVDYAISGKYSDKDVYNTNIIYAFTDNIGKFVNMCLFKEQDGGGLAWINEKYAGLLKIFNGRIKGSMVILLASNEIVGAIATINTEKSEMAKKIESIFEEKEKHLDKW